MAFSTFLGTHWKSARQELVGEGAPEDLLAAVDAAVEQGHTGGDTLAVLASPEGMLRVALPDPPRQDLARLASLPHGAPVLENRQRAIPHVTVVTDRTGADIVQAIGADEVDTSAVEGESLHITRSAPGGWSQRRFQQRAENVWEDNARLVAEAVTSAVDEIQARVVIVAGDVRATSFLLEHLAERIVKLTVQAETTEPESLAAETVRHVATVAAADTRELLEQLRARPADHVAQGADATVAALQAAAVDVLLVHNDPADERTALIGDEPAVIALDQDSLVVDDESGNVRSARLVDAVIRTALATGASVRVVPDHVVEDGLAGLLRFPIPSISKANDGP